MPKKNNLKHSNREYDICRINDFTGNQGVFIERINGALTMVAVRDDNFSVHRIPDQQQWRYFLSRLNFQLILFDMSIADPQQRQTRCPENVLGFELRQPIEHRPDCGDVKAVGVMDLVINLEKNHRLANYYRHEEKGVGLGNS